MKTREKKIKNARKHRKKREKDGSETTHSVIRPLLVLHCFARIMPNVTPQCSHCVGHVDFMFFFSLFFYFALAFYPNANKTEIQRE